MFVVEVNLAGLGGVTQPHLDVLAAFAKRRYSQEVKELINVQFTGIS